MKLKEIACFLKGQGFLCVFVVVFDNIKVYVYAVVRFCNITLNHFVPLTTYIKSSKQNNLSECSLHLAGFVSSRPHVCTITKDLYYLFI